MNLGRRGPREKSGSSVGLSPTSPARESWLVESNQRGNEQGFTPVIGLQEVVRAMSPHIISPGHALRLRATQVLQTSSGETRATGEEWLVRDVGAYLPGVFEEVYTGSLFTFPPPSLSLPQPILLQSIIYNGSEIKLQLLVILPQVVSMVKAVTLTPKLALHIRAIDSYTDQFGRKRCVALCSGTLDSSPCIAVRHVGDEWLITDEDTECYIPDVTEVNHAL